MSGVAEDQNIRIGLVIVALVKIRDDIRAELVPAEVKPARIGFAAVVEGVEICYRACREHPFKLAGEHVVSGGTYGEKALPLAQHEPVHIELTAHQLGENIGLEELQRIGIMSGQLQKHSAVQERLPVSVHGGYQRDHILQIAFGGDGLLEVVGIALIHAVLVGGIVDDLLFLGRRYLTGIDAQGHAVLFAKVAQDGLFLGSSGIFPQHPHTAVGVAAEEVVGVEFDDARCDHVKEILDFYILLRRRLALSFSCHQHFFLSDFDFGYKKSRHVYDGLG